MHTRLSKDVLVYFFIFLTSLLVFIGSFNLFENFYAVYFLKPVSFAGYSVLRQIGIPVAFNSNSVLSGFCDYNLQHHILRVNFGCTGIYALFIFLAGVIAYPAPVKAKIRGFGKGIPIFLLYSIVRLIIMGITGNYFVTLLPLVHNYLMVAVNIVFILWLYSFWIRHDVQKNI